MAEVFRLVANEGEAKEKSRSYKFCGFTREICDYPPVLQAYHIQELLGYSEGKAYEILRSKGCPTVRDGKRMTVPRDLFWDWYLKRAKERMNEAML